MRKKFKESGDWRRKFMWFFLESDPKEIMKNVKSFDDQTLIKLAQTTDEHPSYGSPREFQIRAINRELKNRFGVKPSGKHMKESYAHQLRTLLESEVEQAESLIAARSFSQEMQSMLEKLGRLMNEDLPAVSEQMRNSFGPDVATGFENQTTSVLQSVMDNLRSSKQEIDNSVAEISAGGTPTGRIDMEDPEVNDEVDLGDDDLDLDLDLDLETDDADIDVEVDAPEDETLGRAKKESVETIKHKITEMKKIVEKAKKIKKEKKK